MELLTETLKRTVSKLSDDVKDEMLLNESIIDIKDSNKNEILEKILKFLDIYSTDHLKSIIIRLRFAMVHRPKEREAQFSVYQGLREEYKDIIDAFPYIPVIGEMIRVRCGDTSNLVNNDYKHVFDFAEEGTVERAIFDDDVEKLIFILSEVEKQDNIPLYKNDFCRIIVGANMLGTAALFGSVKCFKYLIMNGEIPNVEVSKLAIAGGNNEIVHLCEQNGSMFDDCLNVSVSYHRFELYEWLVQHFDCEKIELSYFLCCCNEPLFFNYLENLDHELDNDEIGELLCCAARNTSYGVVKHFLSRGFNANWSNPVSTLTPLHEAANIGSLEIVKYLVENGCNVNSKSNSGRTPLFSAAFKGNAQIIEYLAQKGADMNSQVNTGLSPLHTACVYGTEDAIIALVKNGCDVNIKENDGNTPLHCLMEQGKIKIIKFLVDNGADINIKNNDGFLPFDLVPDNKREKILEALKQ